MHEWAISFSFDYSRYKVHASTNMTSLGYILDSAIDLALCTMGCKVGIGILLTQSWNCGDVVWLYLPVCFNMSNIFAWKTGSTASTLTPWKERAHYSSWLSLNTDYNIIVNIIIIIKKLMDDDVEFSLIWKIIGLAEKENERAHTTKH